MKILKIKCPAKINLNLKITGKRDDGFHNIESIMKAFSVAEETKGKPTCIIAKTIKGKGVSFMENNVEWHGKAINDEEYGKAISELAPDHDSEVEFQNKIKENLNNK